MCFIPTDKVKHQYFLLKQGITKTYEKWELSNIKLQQLDAKHINVFFLNQNIRMLWVFLTVIA